MYQLPIQEDETAIALHALWKHYERSQDLEYIESIYNSFIEPAADFLITYRHDETGLPKRSYDLWEERIGVHTYTASSVYGALQSVGKFARLLGKEVEAKRCEGKAEEVKQRILQYLYDKDKGYFVRSGDVEEGEFVQDPTVDFSAGFGVWYFGVLEADDERVVRSMKLAENVLRVPGVGGLARHERDTYFRNDAYIGEEAPGNPWFVTTLWYAQYLIHRASDEAELQKVVEVIEWVANHTTSSGLLSEQLDLKTGVPLSATPLVWSHGEFVTTVVDYLDKLLKLGACDNCDIDQNNCDIDQNA
jgi:GH15 family glucan-1,4-alpha-glucosidase